MKEKMFDYIIHGRLHGVKPVTKEEYMKNHKDRCLCLVAEAFGCESNKPNKPDKPYTPYAFWGETWIPKEDTSPYILRAGEGVGDEVDTNETPKEEAKINLGENIDETRLVLGDTPFLDKYIPIEWLEHYAESYEKNANQLQVLISRPEDPFRPLLANQYRQVLTAWRISGAASYPLWKSSVQNTDTLT